MDTTNLNTITLNKTKKAVGILNYYPYGASQATQAIFLSQAKIDMSDALKGKKTEATEGRENIKMDEISGSVIKQITDEKIKFMVKTIDGRTFPTKEELLAEIYELPASDVEQIKDELTRIEDEDTVSDPKEQTSQEPTPTL